MSIPRLRPTTSEAGFTLIELLMAVAITGILATVAAPSFNSMIESQRAKSASTDLYIALTHARSEAIKRNANITISPNGGDWTNGWQVLDPASALIQDHAAVRTVSIAGPTSVVYRASGRLLAGTAPSFAITGSLSTSARCVAVDLSGRPNIKAGSC